MDAVDIGRRFVVAAGPFVVHRPHARSAAGDQYDVHQGEEQVDIRRINLQWCARLIQVIAML